MQHAIENELSAKSQLDMEQQRLGQVENEIDMEREKVSVTVYPTHCCKCAMFKRHISHLRVQLKGTRALCKGRCSVIFCM